MSSDIETALGNLEAIKFALCETKRLTESASFDAVKSGDDPREDGESESATSSAAASTTPMSDALENPDDALDLAHAEVDRLYDEHSEVRDNLPRNDLHVGIARWKGRHGVCKYNTQLNQKRFGERMGSQPTRNGHHTIVINEKVFEDGGKDEFVDVVRHELAHAVCYAIHGTSQKHNHKWKAMAAKLGADPSSTHHRRDRSDEYKYYINCPNCGYEGGRTRMCKVIKKPFHRKCGRCDHSPMSSYESGEEPPTKSGVVEVDRVPWNDEDEWRAQ